MEVANGLSTSLVYQGGVANRYWIEKKLPKMARVFLIGTHSTTQNKSCLNITPFTADSAALVTNAKPNFVTVTRYCNAALSPEIHRAMLSPFIQATYFYRVVYIAISRRVHTEAHSNRKTWSRQISCATSILHTDAKHLLMQVTTKRRCNEYRNAIEPRPNRSGH